MTLRTAALGAIAVALILVACGDDGGGGGSAPITGRIAFVSDRDGNDEVYIMNADGSGLARLTENSQEVTSLAWSLDGTRVAYTSGQLANRGISVVDADGSNLIRLTDGRGLDSDPAWSPDGTLVAFDSFREGDTLSLYVVRTGGSAATKITDDSRDDVHPAWSPDGTRIAYTSCRNLSGTEWEGLDLVKQVADFDCAIVIINDDGSDRTRLVGQRIFPDTSPVWSPNGEKIAFDACFGLPESCQRAMFVMRADGADMHRLTANPSGFADAGEAWSPDGSLLALRCDDEAGSSICIVGSDGAGRTTLTNNPRFDSNPAWSPDGKWIAFDSGRDLTGDDPRQIIIVSVDGSNTTQLTNDASVNSLPVWSAEASKNDNGSSP